MRGLQMAAILLFLVLAPLLTSVHAAEPEKEATALMLRADGMGSNKYNLTVRLQRMLIDLDPRDDSEAKGVTGEYAGRGIQFVPLAGKEVEIYFPGTITDAYYGECTTDAGGVCGIEADLNEIKLDERGCTKFVAKFAGDGGNTQSKSGEVHLCAIRLVGVQEAARESVKAIGDDVEKSNVCLGFFIFMGFLMAGLYASGQDPLRLLDITTPRLPASRKKPEIRFSMEDDALRNMRKNINRLESELKGIEGNTIRNISRGLAKKEVAEYVRVKKGGMSEGEYCRKNRSFLKRIEAKSMERHSSEISNELERIRNEEMGRLRESTAKISSTRAILVEKETIVNIYGRIKDRLDAYAAGLESRLYSEIKEATKKLHEASENYAKSLHLTNQLSLIERGGWVGKGLVSRERTFIERIPVVGYTVRAANNILGYAQRGAYYVRDKYKGQREISGLMGTGRVRTIYEELEGRKGRIRGLQDRMVSVEDEARVREGQERDIAEKRRIRSEAEREISTIRRELGTERKGMREFEDRLGEDERAVLTRIRELGDRGFVLPDIVKDRIEAVEYARSLGKEIINGANHLLLREIAKGMNEDEFDRWYGAVVAERDVARRNIRIAGKARELSVDKGLIDESTSVRMDVKQRLDDPFGNSGYFVGKAREMAQNPERYGLLIVDQEDEIARYIELNDFVAPGALEKCREEGFKAGIGWIRSKESMEDAEAIRRTHAGFNSYGERFTARIKDIRETMLPFMVYSREFERLVRHLADNGLVSGRISREKLDKLRVYYARELRELSERQVSESERFERAAEVRMRVLSSLREIDGGGVPDSEWDKVRIAVGISQSELAGIIRDFGADDQKRVMGIKDVLIEGSAEYGAMENEVLKEAKGGGLDEIMVREWAQEMALNRAIGMTKPAMHEKDIVDLANKAEDERVAYEQLMGNAREYNNLRRPQVMKINSEIKAVEDIAGMDAQDILIENDRAVKKALLPALVKLFEEASKEGPAYRNLYVKGEIGGLEHVFIKGAVHNPTEDDVFKMVKLFEKELPHKKERLLELIAQNVPEEIMGRHGPRDNDGRKKVAEHFLEFRSMLNKYALLHPGAELPYDAAGRFGWIAESKGPFKAVRKDAPKYETMGPADRLLNYGVDISSNGKVRFRAAGEKNWLRDALNWLEVQGNHIVGGEYIGLMAESVSTNVMYTRYANAIKTMGRFYHGKDTFASDVMRNPELCDALLEAYKLRAVMGKASSDALDLLKPEVVRKGLVDAIDSVVSNERNGIEGRNSALRKLYSERGSATGERRDVIDAEIRSLGNENKAAENRIEGLKKSKSEIAWRDLGRKEELDLAIEMCAPHAGEYLMQEKLNDLVSKSQIYAKEEKQKLGAVHDDMVFNRKIASKIAKGLAKAIGEYSLKLNTDGERILSELKNAREPGELKSKYEELLANLKGYSGLSDDDMRTFGAAIRRIEVEFGPKADSLNERMNALERQERQLKGSIEISNIMCRPSLWRLRVNAMFAREGVKRALMYMKGKALGGERFGATNTNVVRPRNNLVEEIFEYSKGVKEKRKKRSRFQRDIDDRLRNVAFITDKFLDHAQARWSTLDAGLHSRRSRFGLDWMGTAGMQFAGPIASSLMQRLSTFGKYSNRGWLTSLFLSYPIMRAQQIYKKRWPILHMMSGIPAAYEPMKGKKMSASGFMQAFFYRNFKDRVARFGEAIRTTAKDMPPRAFMPYLLTSNPFGETRMWESLDLFGDTFRATPRGPRDMLNYMLYKPNDIVMDFKDMIYTMKEGRSMKKTPEHLMDVGMYGVGANTKFIAGREIESFSSALGGPEAVYPQRAFNTMYYNPQLSVPGLRYHAYGDIYKRTSKPTEVAREMMYMSALSRKTIFAPMIVVPGAVMMQPFLHSAFSMLLSGTLGFASASSALLGGGLMSVGPMAAYLGYSGGKRMLYKGRMVYSNYMNRKWQESTIYRLREGYEQGMYQSGP